MVGLRAINRKIEAWLRHVYGLHSDESLRLKLDSFGESKHKLVG